MTANSAACGDWQHDDDAFPQVCFRRLSGARDGPVAAAELEIVLDRAQVFNIPLESKTLIIGNPTIADVSIIQRASWSSR